MRRLGQSLDSRGSTRAARVIRTGDFLLGEGLERVVAWDLLVPKDIWLSCVRQNLGRREQKDFCLAVAKEALSVALARERTYTQEAKSCAEGVWAKVSVV